MHAWLKRAVAGLLSAGTLLGGGLLTAGTANADEIRMPDIGKTITSLTASAATTYPRELVNGGFDYLPDGGWKTVDAPSYMTNAYTSVDPNNGQYMRNAKHSDADLASWVDWPGFDQSKFAWKTDQKGGHDQGGLKDRAEAVELQQDSMDGNTYAEMVASEPGRTIYQNLATIPGTLYKIRLKHTSLCKDNVDQMQVVINGTPIEMTRVAANGKAGDKVGEKSKTIGTRVTNENRWHHSDQWETYEGYYVIPDGQTTTRFGFKAVNYLDPTKGNLLDDVTFARAYKLSYDKNASDATGKVPSDETADTVRQTKARTSRRTGSCPSPPRCPRWNLRSPLPHCSRCRISRTRHWRSCESTRRRSPRRWPRTRRTCSRSMPPATWFSDCWRPCRRTTIFHSSRRTSSSTG